MKPVIHSLLGASAMLFAGTSGVSAHPGHETLPGLLHSLTSFSHGGALLLAGIAVAALVLRQRRAANKDRSDSV